MNEARRNSRSMYEQLRIENPLSGKAQSQTDALVKKAQGWTEKAAEPGCDFAKLLDKILNESGYMAMLEADNEADRIDNIKALMQDLKQYQDNNPESTLDEYLQMISLYTDREEVAKGECIKLMTVHSAKGLEFDYVFVCGLSDGVFPNRRSVDETGSRGMEEERRLAYVAFTRARKKLYLLDAGGYDFISQAARRPSRFIKEIDKAYIEHIGVLGEEGYRPSFGYGSWHETSRPANVLASSESKPKAQERIDLPKKTKITKGSLVTDEKYGNGVVIKVENNIAEVAFKNNGIHKVMLGHGRLKLAQEKGSVSFAAKEKVIHDEYGNGVVVKVGDKLKIAFGLPAGVKLISPDDPALHKKEE